MHVVINYIQCRDDGQHHASRFLVAICCRVVEAMIKDIDTHIKKMLWELINCSDLPENTGIIPAVWFMCRE